MAVIRRSTDGNQRVLSLSYGKDSMACLGAIEILDWPLDRIVTADVWATDTIPADLPPMVEFKAKSDAIIKERYGIEVEHFIGKNTYEHLFYRKYGKKSTKCGEIYGFPISRGKKNKSGNWCNSDLKMSALNIAMKSCKGCIQYLGIASDEPNRFHTLSEIKKSPLVEVGWAEADCRKWCEEHDLLSPIYTDSARGGCWFCHNQGVGQLRLLRKNYPELWALLLEWDNDSPVTFHADGHTVHDFDRRFQCEDEGIIYADERFKWADIEQPQMRLF